MATRLEAARVLWPDGTLRPGALTIDGGRIAAVDELAPRQAAGAPDRTLAPGLVDLQVNGRGHLDVATGSADDLTRLGHELAAAGTTGWCPTLTSRPLGWYAEWFAEHPDRAPGEIGVHLEGPFLARAGAHRPEHLRPPDADWLSALPGRVAMVTLAPELPGATDAVRLLAERGVVVCLGHSEGGLGAATAAAGAGAAMVTHIFNAMAPLRAREPGLVGAALTDDRLVPAVIGDGVHVHPAVLKLVCSRGTTVLVTDSVAWERPGLSVVGGAARLPDGTIAGSVVTLAEAVRVAVEAGVPLGAALVAATVTPARLLDPAGRRTSGVERGVGGRGGGPGGRGGGPGGGGGGPGGGGRGRLVPGARADVIALDADLAVGGVWVEGRSVGP